MYCPDTLVKHGRSLVLTRVFFPLIKVPPLPLRGRDLGLGLEPRWEDKRGWEKPGDMMAVPYKIRSTALGLGGGMGVREWCVPLP